MKNITLSKLLLFLIALLATFGQFARLSTMAGAVNWYELVMLLMIIYSFIKYRGSWWSLLKTKTYWLLFIWVAWILASTIFNSFNLNNIALLINGGAYLARTILYLGFAGNLLVLIEKKEVTVQFLQWGLIASLTIQMIIGLGQYLFYPDTRILFYLGWDDHLSRAFGTLFDPGFFGLIMVLGVLICAHLLQTKYRRYLVALLAMFMLALAVSFSRASYVALTVGVLIFGVRATQRRWWLLIPLLLFTLLLVPKDGGGEGQKLLRTQSVAERTEIAQRHLDQFPWQQWLVGRGWYYQTVLNYHHDSNEDNIPQHSQAVDNIYLHIFLSTGAVGALISLVTLGYILWITGKDGLISASWSSVLAHSFFSTALFYPWVMLTLAILTVTFFTGKQPGSHHKSK